MKQRMTAALKAAKAHYAQQAAKSGDGCVLIFDDHHGIYMSKMVQEEAIACGWPKSKAVLEIDKEWFHEAADEAVDWLNANVAPEEWVFSFEEGGFFFMSTLGYDDNGWSEERYRAIIRLRDQIDELKRAESESDTNKLHNINNALSSFIWDNGI